MRRLKDQSQLVTKDLKWYENFKVEKWRKTELEKIKKKREVAKKVMHENIETRRLAGQILSSISFLNSNQKFLLNPLNQLDSEVAEAGAKIILKQLQKEENISPTKKV